MLIYNSNEKNILFSNNSININGPRTTLIGPAWILDSEPEFRTHKVNLTYKIAYNELLLSKLL